MDQDDDRIIQQIVNYFLSDRAGGSKLEWDGEVLSDRDSNWSFDPRELLAVIRKAS